MAKRTASPGAELFRLDRRTDQLVIALAGATSILAAGATYTVTFPEARQAYHDGESQIESLEGRAEQFRHALQVNQEVGIDDSYDRTLQNKIDRTEYKIGVAEKNLPEGYHPNLDEAITGGGGLVTFIALLAFGAWVKKRA